MGWNYSTGAAAVNLALSLGAVRIFLLGFDMGKTKGKSHWHDEPRNVRDEAYLRFLKGFRSVYHELKKFPSVRVFNVTDGSSYVPLADRVECVSCKERAKIAASQLIPTP